MNALAKKLLMKSDQTWLILDSPEEYLAALEPLPAGVALTFTIANTVDGMQLFVKNSAELAITFKRVAALLKPETILWVIFPKKSSGLPTDLEMMSGWETAKIYGLRPVASAAINSVWTALRFRPESLVKHSDSRNEAIKHNDYANYIDPAKKEVKLPADLAAILATKPESLDFFNKLAYSHRKEYIVWVLSAKQEQTRNNRVSKTLKMLLAGKKNPSDK